MYYRFKMENALSTTIWENSFTSELENVFVNMTPNSEAIKHVH